MTNVLVEGGSQVLGSFFDAKLIDAVRMYLAPKIIGGAMSLTPVGGKGIEAMNNVPTLRPVSISPLGDDVFFSAAVQE
jgi:diaminohydroxyphosphoribosylaminopyrimidine deaminase/5-amino-6-(5-phosphoribosylamino)uracil reductase